MDQFASVSWKTRAGLGLLILLLVGAAPWEQPRVPAIAPIAGVGGLAAKDCGVCHQEIYQEWKASSHGWAWKDAQFQAELYKDPEVGWLCVNCHTPMQNQQEMRVIEGGVTRNPHSTPNPDYDKELQQDGVGCLSCHWRPEGIAAPHEGVKAPHPVVYAPELQQIEACTSCHQAKARLEDALVCHFNTGEEWAETGSGKTCQECHMQSVTRAHAAGAPVRKGRRHTWFGGGVPKGPISPEIQALWDEWEPGYSLDLNVPESSALGAQVSASLTLSHARAGHMVPTGDPERHLMVYLEAIADGEVIQTTEHRIGQSWEWSPVARKIGDNRLKPGESREYTLDFSMPQSGVEVRARVVHVRLTQDNWSYHMKLFEADGEEALADALRVLPKERERARVSASVALR